ncbi:hypothetical protein F511_28125 [Dorcoceras hygrometricum]|uniref:Uncharacterized protein n=1 Tax=Dorcoceras hygrometricum TaxID=472368 RepID=A0A2Z7BEZ5_9LAMI|nr:hypothetical protein F511_28125 [Dorcoceras hygrometricum]
MDLTQQRTCATEELTRVDICQDIGSHRHGVASFLRQAYQISRSRISKRRLILLPKRRRFVSPAFIAAPTDISSCTRAPHKQISLRALAVQRPLAHDIEKFGIELVPSGSTVTLADLTIRSNLVDQIREGQLKDEQL